MTALDDRRGEARVAVVGGGLAGLAAAAALCGQGFRVELFEARRRLGGRAGSFDDPISGQLVDHCQHVAMACCTNLADFCRRTGIAGGFRPCRRLHFIGPDRAAYRFSAAPLLPAPLHLVPGLMRLGYLRLADRLRIVRTMTRLARRPRSAEDGGETIGSWLRRQGESERAIEGFWSAVLVSALGESLDRASFSAARQVFVDGFLASRGAYELRVPHVPLGELFDRRLADWLASRGVAVHRSARVTRIEGDGRRARSVLLAGGSRRPFDFYVLAVPWRNVRALLAEAMLEALPALNDVHRFESAPITAVHLWFDRSMTSLPNAVLVGRLGQWLFNGARQAAGVEGSGADRSGSEGSHAGCYYQVVISASHALKGRSREEVAGQVRQELAAIWPAARNARLLRWKVVTNADAVFSPRPGIDRVRPPQQTAVENLALAGDWTATGWPATMEGAVRSGYLAAEAVLRQGRPGTGKRLLVPDLPWGRLTRWIIGTDREP